MVLFYINKLSPTELQDLKKNFLIQLCRLGRHAPIRRVLRDGIMRVSKRAAGKVANEALDDWFTLLGDSQVFTKLRMYSQVWT